MPLCWPSGLQDIFPRTDCFLQVKTKEMDYAWAVLTLGIYDNWQILRGQQECHYSCWAAPSSTLKILQRW